MANNHATYRQDQAFFLRLAVAIFVLVVIAFLQWALRGFSNVAAAPLTVHIHGIAMLGWLGLFIVQNHLAGRGNLAAHRKLGWFGVALALFILGIGTQVTLQAIALHRVPPIFTDPYFLMLGPIHLAFFIGVLAGAIRLRRSTEWHRRLMLVATVVLMEPAFGRLVPGPIIMTAWGPWIEGALQAAVLGIAMLHDRRTRGAVHPALWCGVAVIFLCKAAVNALAGSAPVIAWAEALAAT